MEHAILKHHDPKTVKPPQPLYKQVKDLVIDKILKNEWPPYSQIPSEHSFVRDMKISRMTIHRALRELTQEGYLDRIQGVGTFVAESRPSKVAKSIKEVDVAIRSRGNIHSCAVHFLQAEPIGPEGSSLLHIPEGETVFRLYCVHRENNMPVMLEDRYVHPELAPDFLSLDFSSQTADAYFQKTFNLLSDDHKIEAALTTPEAIHFLELEQAVPCLRHNRRTWIGNQILSSVQYIYPSNRHQITW
ncbi:UTRA domain-containing protein [Sneathiella sp.]|jgi:GntR family histidine utilization transcriptional repressor|uniref:UTRA domain-containing protein n=1 Tax=Sneathiella sp. TaxID=1964365 RepID=UPI0039E3D288